MSAKRKSDQGGCGGLEARSIGVGLGFRGSLCAGMCGGEDDVPSRSGGDVNVSSKRRSLRSFGGGSRERAN